MYHKLSIPLKLFIIFTLAVFYCFLISCSESGTGPKSKPPGFQEDIPWPSLADSPWPMYRADPQNTGRAKSVGPRNGTIQWALEDYDVRTGIAVGVDSSIYFATTGKLIALKYSGEIKWAYSAVNIPPSSPLVDWKGNIYFSDQSKRTFNAINPDGSLEWQVDNVICDLSGINIGLDGAIYFCSSEDNITQLYSISSQGQINWVEPIPEATAGESSGFSFSPDGKTLYLPGLKDISAVVAFDIESRTVKWSFGKGRVYVNPIPIVDSNGNIYTLSKNDNDDGYLYCIDKNGDIIWKSYLNKFSKIQNYDHFALDKMGNIYTGNDTVYSINYKGELRFKKAIDYGGYDISSPLTIDSEGFVYFTVGSSLDKELWCLSPVGDWIFKISLPETRQPYSYSPGIGYDSALYLPGYHDNIIISIK